MSAQLARRGPDDEQFIADQCIAFVFRRLAIVDLETGGQPIWNETKTMFAAVNGEIYNHKELRSKLRQNHQFRTKSDSEIVLHLYEEYGGEMVGWLNGMFAIAIWDTVKEELFIARDRLGIKPLYYVHRGKDSDIPFMFGSEIKALLAHPNCPREISWEDIAVARGYGAARLTTFVDGIDQLPGGFCAVYCRGQLRKSRYWSLETCIAGGPDLSKGAPDFKEEYSGLLEESVKLRLMSDVPLGSFLSGGLDSALITAIASQQNREFHCFNIVEPTARESGDTERARALAECRDIKLHQVLFDYQQLPHQLSFSLETFEYFTWLMEAPLFDPEWVFKHELHRFARTVEPQLKVILIGQGADEFAGGYSNPFDTPRSDWGSYLEHLRQKQRKEMFKGAGVPASLLPFLSGSAAPGMEIDSSPATFHGEMLQRTLSLQFHNLRHEDRTGAAQGIEARVPFLDHRLVELLASIPPGLHPGLFWDKHIIRQAAEQWLPQQFCRAPKVRFFAGRDRTHINNLLLQMVKNVFPAFREKYLQVPSALFSAVKLTRMYRQINTPGMGSMHALQTLLDCMVIVVFQRICRQLKEGWCPGGLNPPSPLLEIDITRSLPQSR
jgi:asparagine synthase (glutamine-hydrolysing)